jgi:integrase
MSRPRITKLRCSDPYQESSGRWRVVTRSREGEEGRRSFATEEEAWTYVRTTRALYESRNRTIEQALSDFLRYKTAQGKKQSTRNTLSFRLRRFFAPKDSIPVGELTPAYASELYDLYRVTCSAATHHGALASARQFADWCVKEQLLSTNPFSKVEALGRPRKGKAQLHLDEARKLMDAAACAYLEGDEGGLAVLMALLLGLRAGEIVGRQVRDVDDGGLLLWVGALAEDDTKTESSVRRVEVPPDLAVMLKRQAHGKEPAADLFAHTGASYVCDATRRLCRRAGVPEITAQGLRGTHATFAVGAGTSGHIVAMQLGHSSFRMTSGGHYATQGSVHSGKVLRVSDQLTNRFRTISGPSPETAPNRNSGVQ